jgi:hypothetical protein
MTYTSGDAMDEDTKNSNVVPHIVDLPLASECEHREVVYYHASISMQAMGEVQPVRLRKAVQVVDLGETWRLRELRVITPQGPVEAEFTQAEECSAALYAYRVLDELLDQIPRFMREGRVLTMIQRSLRDKGKADICLPPRQTSNLPRFWACFEREWVRLPVTVWRDEDGRFW